MPKRHQFRELQDQRFGRLIVTNLDHIEERRQRVPFWKCECDCGNFAVVGGSELTQGRTRSCGCLRQRHGHAGHKGNRSRAYRSWLAMRARCSNPKKPNYKYYGGRGIVVCPRWQGDFEAFFADMGNCPDGCSIDRVDADGNYEPFNCRWATRIEQARHHRQYVEDENGKLIRISREMVTC